MVLIVEPDNSVQRSWSSCWVFAEIEWCRSRTRRRARTLAQRMRFDLAIARCVCPV